MKNIFLSGIALLLISACGNFDRTSADRLEGWTDTNIQQDIAHCSNYESETLCSCYINGAAAAITREQFENYEIGDDIYDILVGIENECRG